MLSAEEMLIRHDWARFCISLGGLLSIAGAVVLLTTIVTLLIRPSDRAGSIVAGALFVLVLAGVAAWIGLFLSQHQGLGFRREAPAQMSTEKREPRANVRQEEYAATEATGEKPLAVQEVTPAASSQPVHQNRVRVRPTVRPVAPAVHADTELDAGHPDDIESGTSDEAVAAESTTSVPDESATPQSFRGVRFARPQRHEAEQASGTKPAVPAPAVSEQQAEVDTEGPALEPEPVIDSNTSPKPEPVADNNTPTDQAPRGAEDLGGDDIVSSVTVLESRTEDVPVMPTDSPEQTTPSTGDRDDTVSSADAYMQRDVALANLRLRRGNRSVHKDT